MFRTMRRKKQILTEEEMLAVIERGTSGVLAVLGDEGYPYAVPISYVYHEGKFYFHGAKAGHKIDAIKQYEKASFCIIDQDQVVSEAFTTYFRSVIAFGKIHILEDDVAKRKSIEILAAKYAPNDEAGRLLEIEKDYKPLCMIELEVEHMTGKEAIELIREKTNV